MGVRLPPEYQEVEWIGSNNDAYLVIKNAVGLPEVTNLKVKTTVLWKYVLSRQVHGRNGRCYFGVVDGYYQNTQTGTDHTQIEAVANEWASVEWSRNDSVCSLKVGNDIDIKNSTITATNPLPFALFALGDGSIRDYCALKETQVEIGSEQFDLVPCYRKQDSKPGMYDLASDTFFVNQGYREFDIGPDVIDSISPMMVAWRRMLMQKGVHFPYVYKNGCFAQEFGKFTLLDPPLTNFRLPDEYHFSPEIYGHFTRNRTAPLNDALAIKSGNNIDLSEYGSIRLQFYLQQTVTGGLVIGWGDEVTNTDDRYYVKILLQNISSGNHDMTLPINNFPSSASKLFILIYFTSSSYNLVIKINSIELIKKENES